MTRSTVLTLATGALLGFTIAALAPALTPSASAQPGQRGGPGAGERFPDDADGPRGERLQRIQRLRERVRDRRAGDSDDNERLEGMLSLIEETNPEMHARLIELRENNPERFARAMRRAAPRLKELATLREHDPEAFELRRRELQISREIFQLLRRVAGAAPDDLTADMLEDIQNRLEVLLAQQFEIRIQLGQRHIERLEERLEKLRAEINNRLERRDQLIDDRAAELLRKALERGPLTPDDRPRRR